MVCFFPSLHSYNTNKQIVAESVNAEKSSAQERLLVTIAVVIKCNACTPSICLAARESSRMLIRCLEMFLILLLT